MSRFLSQMAIWMAHPVRRSALRLLVLALALLAGWLMPHHVALADAYLIPGGSGV